MFPVYFGLAQNNPLPPTQFCRINGRAYHKSSPEFASGAT